MILKENCHNFSRYIPYCLLHLDSGVSATIRKNVVFIVPLLFICLHLNGCQLAHILSTQYSDNIAIANYGTEANHPGLNDGNLQTVATLPAQNERNFVIRFADIHPVRKIIIHNGNLFRFQMESLNPETNKWETFHSVTQRRNLEGKRAQPTFVIDRLNLQTQMIRIAVTRTVDDIVVNKVVTDPGDKVVNRRMTMGSQYFPHYRVVRPSKAQIREIEIYHLAKK